MHDGATVQLCSTRVAPPRWLHYFSRLSSSYDIPFHSSMACFLRSSSGCLLALCLAKMNLAKPPQWRTINHSAAHDPCSSKCMYVTCVFCLHFAQFADTYQKHPQKKMGLPHFLFQPYPWCKRAGSGSLKLSTQIRSRTISHTFTQQKITSRFLNTSSLQNLGWLWLPWTHTTWHVPSFSGHL